MEMSNSDLVVLQVKMSFGSRTYYRLSILERTPILKQNVARRRFTVFLTEAFSWIFSRWKVKTGFPKGSIN